MKKRFEDILIQLRNNDRSVKELNLSYNNMGNQGVKHLSAALKCNTNLINLNLAYNDIGEIGVNYLSKVLQSNTSLTRLNLKYNLFDTESIGYLAEALKSNYTLLELKSIDSDEIQIHLAKNKLIESCLPQGLTYQDKMAVN
ncbi:Gala protein type 1, 3 or 4 [Legionella beliardensis]|uniref:Gala protein type 1, 3 or 4 n=1 Tax=Legionella beliardensis TaxID=91822 RepID=A0A378HYH3_9GAMM|nr:hypothetical protein [Legionella beliardensis]STX27949.1 Gala protein type 1, 3 or 4 [Legionella beliardensis]